MIGDSLHQRTSISVLRSKAVDNQSYNRLVRDYLKRLDAALKERTSVLSRKEVVDEVRQHIEEAWASLPNHSRADLLNILERLGEPESLAREYAEDDARGSKQPKTSLDLPAIAVVILTALFWPIGILLAWVSNRWLVRDKAIATLLVVGGFVLFVLMITPAQSSGGTSGMSYEPADKANGYRATTRFYTKTQNGIKIITCHGTLAQCEPQPGALENAAGAVMGILAFGGIYLIAAIYLAVRKLPDPTRAAEVVPISIGLFVTAFLMSVVIWSTSVS